MGQALYPQREAVKAEIPNGMCYDESSGVGLGSPSLDSLAPTTPRTAGSEVAALGGGPWEDLLAPKEAHLPET